MQQNKKLSWWICGVIFLSLVLVFYNDMNQILYNGKWEGLLYNLFPYNKLITVDTVLASICLGLSGFCLYKILHSNPHKLRNILLYILSGCVGFVVIMMIFMTYVSIVLM